MLFGLGGHFIKNLIKTSISIVQNIFFLWIYDVIGIKVQIPIPTFYRRKFQRQFYEIFPFVISLQLNSLSLSSIIYIHFIHILSISLPMIWIKYGYNDIKEIYEISPNSYFSSSWQFISIVNIISHYPYYIHMI